MVSIHVRNPAIQGTVLPVQGKACSHVPVAAVLSCGSVLNQCGTVIRCATSNTVVVTIGVSKSATKEGVVLVPAVGCAHVRVAKLLTHSHAPKKSPVVETPVEKSYPVEYTCVLNAATKGLVQRAYSSESSDAAVGLGRKRLPAAKSLFVRSSVKS